MAIQLEQQWWCRCLNHANWQRLSQASNPPTPPSPSWGCRQWCSRLQHISAFTSFSNQFWRRSWCLHFEYFSTNAKYLKRFCLHAGFRSERKMLHLKRWQRTRRNLGRWGNVHSFRKAVSAGALWGSSCVKAPWNQSHTLVLFPSLCSLTSSGWYSSPRSFGISLLQLCSMFSPGWLYFVCSQRQSSLDLKSDGRMTLSRGLPSLDNWTVVTYFSNHWVRKILYIIVWNSGICNSKKKLVQ